MLLSRWSPILPYESFLRRRPEAAEFQYIWLSTAVVLPAILGIPSGTVKQPRCRYLSVLPTGSEQDLTGRGAGAEIAGGRICGFPFRLS